MNDMDQEQLQNWLIEDTDGHIEFFKWLSQNDSKHVSILLSIIREDAINPNFDVAEIGLDDDSLIDMMVDSHRYLDYVWLSDLIEIHMEKLSPVTQSLIIELSDQCATFLIDSGK